MLKKVAKKMFAGPESVIFKKNNMMKVFKHKRSYCVYHLIVSIGNDVLSRGMQR